MNNYNNNNNHINLSNEGLKSQDSAEMSNSSDKSFSLKTTVRKGKNQLLKIRCERAITACGLSNQQFYLKANISRQQWYHWSWGREDFPDWLKVRLCDMFGKPFIDLFLIETIFKSELEPHPYHKQSSNVQELNGVENGTLD